ncbi:SDR family NAD(P)-dependent oxidoreductase [Vreelandella andesensis]|uniref:SDR family NAD(P)-dependent oxidoreductase n=1 Tax=Vreelandella andesensis TaxID=447567 RepID=A0A3S0W949_9GAMM|nr:SDR family NAD(P)-dependent oxidoreductase [Halomonas andesensis]RUR32187.1 SDR family NAD(P)-dependent oxidoreductase [Halomonas andesensis]
MRDELPLAHNTSIITGASSGIGWALAQQLAHRGHTLYLLARREAPLLACLETLQQRYPKGNFHVLPGDLIDPRQRHGVLTRLRTAIGTSSVDAIIHCAGTGLPAANLADWHPDDLSDALQLNTVVPLALVNMLLPCMTPLPVPCRIVLVGAGIDRHVQRGTGSYGVSKMAMRRLFEQLHEELTSQPAEIALMQPGVVDTPGLRQHIRTARAMKLPHADYLQTQLDTGQAFSAETVGERLATLLDVSTSQASFSGREWRTAEIYSNEGG